MPDITIPILNGNWVDLIILVLIFYYLLEGWGKGLLFGLIDLTGFILSFVIALKLYPWVGDLLIDNFSLSKGIGNASGFLLSGMVIQMVFSLIITLLYSSLTQALHRDRTNGTVSTLLRLDRFLGFIPAIGEALILAAFILTLLVTLPIQGYVKKAIVSSKIGGPLVSRTQGIERQINTVFGEAVNETLTFLTINSNPASGEKIDLGFTQSQLTIDEAAETSMLTLVNQERGKAGLRPLTMSAPLRTLSRDYAKDMFERGYFSHYNPEGESPFDRMERYNISFLAAGENLALAPNTRLAHEGLMHSPGHRANILSPDFGKVGIGAIDGGIYGQMFVQEFTD